MGKVVAVCVSKEKGTRKTNVGAAKLLRDWGIENDAHGGRWHRQVSLLSFEKTEEFRQKGVEIPYGAFGENLLVSGYIHKMRPEALRLRQPSEPVLPHRMCMDFHPHPGPAYLSMCIPTDFQQISALLETGL